ncbi:response regulator transcription factor [Ideonella sp. B7]|uniref:response regulator n=1 Tax=Ideonella benzenivorans TaxID=2831643 RepID=UPI001CECA1C1|nr:response regulator transcription factor [Ideonella benzenivorans]MCA6216423.1 response regulator transcription factor [Ideonella benzenivorans]
MRILLVEDDELLQKALASALAEAGLALDVLCAAEPALDVLAHGMHDLAIVDIGLPGMDGLSLVRRLRAGGNKVPVLMLTARDGLDDRVRGLNEGADDYLIKPFLLPELLARVQALIRRSQSAASSRVAAGPLVMDIASHEAELAGQPLGLTGREWDLLLALVLAMPKVLAKRKLADSLSRWDKEITDNAIEIYVSRVRGKLADSGVTIRTVRGIGYRLDIETA